MSTAKGSYGMRNTAIDLDRMSDVIARSCGVQWSIERYQKGRKRCCHGSICVTTEMAVLLKLATGTDPYPGLDRLQSQPDDNSPR